MTTFNLTIEMDNAAFEDDSEVSRILRELAERLEGARFTGSGRVFDVNGNGVGTWGITDEQTIPPLVRDDPASRSW